MFNVANTGSTIKFQYDEKARAPNEMNRKIAAKNATHDIRKKRETNTVCSASVFVFRSYAIPVLQLYSIPNCVTLVFTIAGHKFVSRYIANEMALSIPCIYCQYWVLSPFC